VIRDSGTPVSLCTHAAETSCAQGPTSSFIIVWFWKDIRAPLLHIAVPCHFARLRERIWLLWEVSEIEQIADYLKNRFPPTPFQLRKSTNTVGAIGGLASRTRDDQLSITGIMPSTKAYDLRQEAYFESSLGMIRNSA
jgi:hypothetical protein